MASDRERELVVDVLRDASTRGQLSVTEFDQRWEYLQAARTVGDLVPLVSDLPNVPSPAERPVGRRRRVVEPPPDALAFGGPSGPPPAPARPDPREIPGAAMLPFEEHAWADPGTGSRRAYDSGSYETGYDGRGYDGAGQPRTGEHRHPADRGAFEEAIREPRAERAGDRTGDRATESAADRAAEPSTGRAKLARAAERLVPRRSPAAGSATSAVSAAEEWNTSLRACVGSFALLIFGLLLAAVLS